MGDGEKVAEIVSRLAGITKERSETWWDTRTRRRPHVGIRWAVYKYLRDILGWGYTRIADAVDRDHTLVIYALKQWDTVEESTRTSYEKLISVHVIPEDLLTVGATL